MAKSSKPRHAPGGGAKSAKSGRNAGMQAPGGGDPADANRLTAIGHAIWLMSRSPVHKHLMITDTEWLVTPPILLNQFRLWQNNGTPLGFVSWAFLGE